MTQTTDEYQELLGRYATTPGLTVSPAVVHEVKRRVIDSCGVMIDALDSDAVRRAQAYARAFPLEGGALVCGTGRRTTPESAAFVNGLLVRYLDFNDTYLSLEPLHPSDVIPALLALAEWRGLGGRALVEAVAVAYEVGVTLCDAASLRAHGWDHVNYIALATACGAARLLGLDAARAAEALALAVTPHAAMRQTRVGELSMWKGAAAANAARNALFATLLAEQGYTGPAEPFVGAMGFFRQLLAGTPFLEEPLAPLGSGAPPRRILDTYIKAYPVEYHAQSAVDAAMTLHRRLGGGTTDLAAIIERVEIETFKAAYEIIAADPEKWRPATRETADHSLPYIVAAVLLDGRVDRGSFAEERLRDPRLRALMGCTDLHETPELTVLYPGSIPNRITVRTVDGETHTAYEQYPRGHARNAMTDEEVVAKSDRNVADVLDRAARDRLLETAWRLDALASVGELTACWPAR
jgi:2-methylcitrate dehydratase